MRYYKKYQNADRAYSTIIENLKVILAKKMEKNSSQVIAEARLYLTHLKIELI